jgi:plasmid stability protein
MANLTVSIDNDLLKRARIRALERDTSVNALVRGYLENLAAESPRSPALEEFLGWARSVHASSGPGGRSWTRDELHER